MITRCAALLAFSVGISQGGISYGAVRFLSTAEIEIVQYTNEARTDPAGFAVRYLAAIARHNRAAAECFQVMKNMKPGRPLAPSEVLSRSAQHHAEDLGRTGNTGHFGSDGSNLSKRILRFGNWTGAIGENCAFGIKTPREIVVTLLIDDGVEGRGHRRNILDPRFRYIGVGIRPHRWFKIDCVQDFASAVVERRSF